MSDFDTSELDRFSKYVTTLVGQGLTEEEILNAAYDGTLGERLGISLLDDESSAPPRFVPVHARRRVSALDFLVGDDNKVELSRGDPATRTVSANTSNASHNAKVRPCFPAMQKFGDAPHKPTFQSTRTSFAASHAR